MKEEPKPPRLETVDDLARVCIKYPWRAEQRYQLKEYRDYGGRRPSEFFLLSGSGYYTKREFAVSAELASAIDGIWTQRTNASWRSTQERAGLLSLATIAKRLGRTDVAPALKAAKRREEEEAARRRRNSLRTQARECAEKLAKVAADLGNPIGDADTILARLDIWVVLEADPDAHAATTGDAQ